MKSEELEWQKSDGKEKKALRHGTSCGRCAKGRQQASLINSKTRIKKHGGPFHSQAATTGTGPQWSDSGEVPCGCRCLKR